MTCPSFFRPHRNLSDEVNSNIVQYEIEGGMNLQNLRPGSALQIHTRHTSYNVLVLFGSLAFISGHRSIARVPSWLRSAAQHGAVPCSRSVLSVEECAWNSITLTIKLIVTSPIQ